MKRRERTVYDGIEQNKALIPAAVIVSSTLVEAWEESLAKLDEEIAAKLMARAAYRQNIAAARKKLRVSQ